MKCCFGMRSSSNTGLRDMLSSSKVLRDRRGGEYKARSEVLRRGYGVELPVPEDDGQVDMVVKAVRTTIPYTYKNNLLTYYELLHGLIVTPALLRHLLIYCTN